MAAPVNVANTATVVLAPNRWGFIGLFNNSDTTIYLEWDGTPDLTTSNGFPLAANTGWVLEDHGGKGFLANGLRAIHGDSGNKELRVQARLL